MKKIKKIQVCFFLAISFFTGITKATSIHNETLQADPTIGNENSWFISIGIGRSGTNLSNSSNTVSNGAPSPYNQDYYSIKNPSTQTQLQFNVGYRWHEERMYIPYYSTFIQYRHYQTTYIKGSVDQYSLPGFVNYNYQMQYTADLFALYEKINLFEYKRISPYLSIGAGVIYNHLNSYVENPLPSVTARDNPGYAGNTNTNLTLPLGIGVDVKLTKNIWATLGYEYLVQGNINTQSGAGSWSGTHLGFGRNTKMNTVFLNISFNIPEGLRSNQTIA